MNLVIIFILAILFCSCSSNLNKEFIPKEFTYPSEKVEHGKLFVYQNEATHDTGITDIRVIESDGTTYETLTIRAGNQGFDSLVRFDGQTLHYSYPSNDGKWIKGEDLENKIVPGKGRLGTWILKRRFRLSSSVITESSEENFLKDTLIYWNGVQIPCLVTKAVATSQFRSNVDTLGGIKKLTRIYYHGKGIGLVRQIVITTDEVGQPTTSKWNLIEIKDVVAQ